MYILNKNIKLNYKIKVIDDFLIKQDFDDLCKLGNNLNNKKDFNVYHNKINNNGVIDTIIDESLLKRIHNNYHQKAMNILKEICPEKLSLYEYSDFTIIVTRKNSKFPIHDDTPRKLLSGVIYLEPQKNSGTIFYSDKKGSNKNNIEWRQNRAVFFSRRERETWHSYEGDGLSNRITLVYNLNTNNIKAVYDVEKKNFFYGNLRFKINPYLSKFFKITI